MTEEAKKSLKAAAGVLVCVAALGFGAVWRDRIELGNISATKVDTSNMLASTSARPDLPETKFFEDMMELLKRKYVDPIDDDMKLADGAVRGMIASLGDPDSLYMDAEQYRVYDSARQGKYEGIGADMILVRDREAGKVKTGGIDGPIDEEGSYRLPKLVIAAVVPGSSADRAGLKAGDQALFVDDHWIPDSAVGDELRHLAEQVKQHKVDAATFLKRQRQIDDLIDKSIYAIKARDRLMIGTTGQVKTSWMRSGQKIDLTLNKGHWEMPGIQDGENGSIRLQFTAGADRALAAQISGKSEVAIDLTNNVSGDFGAMAACLNVLAPKGTYGYIVTHKGERPEPLNVGSGAANPPSIKLYVDKTTRGPAEVFAAALSSRGLAQLVGTLSVGDRNLVKWYRLADGAGYTMVTGEYWTNAPTEAVAHAVDPNREALR